ncbi:hypothetical protein U9M48_025590 [Paspalum notatum var. saurae]|uniref:Uncharacterized protein n=1 Tax=Paspalum notatum var. saurae TaxID=547442 RepID=A0AAQ3TTY8_PASNO
MHATRSLSAASRPVPPREGVRAAAPRWAAVATARAWPAPLVRSADAGHHSLLHAPADQTPRKTAREAARTHRTKAARATGHGSAGATALTQATAAMSTATNRTAASSMAAARRRPIPEHEADAVLMIYLV